MNVSSNVSIRDRTIQLSPSEAFLDHPKDLLLAADDLNRAKTRWALWTREEATWGWGLKSSFPFLTTKPASVNMWLAQYRNLIGSGPSARLASGERPLYKLEN